MHASIPGSLDEYYQEIGRAGRDGEPAAAVCCYRPQDLGLRRFFTGGLPDEKLLARVAAAVDGPVYRRDLAERVDVSQRRLTGLLNLLESAGAVRPPDRERPFLASGTRVDHQDFGRGTVLGIQDGHLTAVFDTTGYKELMAGTVLEEGLLAPITP